MISDSAFSVPYEVTNLQLQVTILAYAISFDGTPMITYELVIIPSINHGHGEFSES